MKNPTDKDASKTLYFAVLLLGTLLIGAVLGAVSLNSYLNRASPDSVDAAPAAPRTGMQILDQYRCMKAETKQIILRGIEDNYAATGDESVIYGPVHEYMHNRSGKKGAVTMDRAYDEGGMDRFFIDHIQVPSRITHGLFVVKTKSLTRTTNDTMNIGEISTLREKSHNRALRFFEASRSDIWKSEGGVYFASLSDLTFKDKIGQDGRNMPRDYDSVLDFIQQAPGAVRSVDAIIGDDHIVDFMGVAICEPPLENRGISFIVSPYSDMENALRLSCSKENMEDHCDPYKGDTLCSTALPMACFSYTGAETPLKLKQTGYERLWSKGRVKFSAPIQGSAFKTQDEAHAYCATTFGSNYRVATHEENLSGELTFVAEGSSDVVQSWVHAQTEPFGNCWDLITDYEAEKP